VRGRSGKSNQRASMALYGAESCHGADSDISRLENEIKPGASPNCESHVARRKLQAFLENASAPIAEERGEGASLLRPLRPQAQEVMVYERGYRMVNFVNGSKQLPILAFPYFGWNNISYP
jgi:hypothetical protein